MKKLLCTLAVLVLLVGTLVVMSACGGADTTAEATTTAPVTTVPVTEAQIPNDYTLYDNGDISFAYPESWAKTDGSTVLLQDAVTGNNITVVYEAKNPIYATLDLDAYNESFKPAFEAMGMTITDAAVAQTENASGLAITKISHTATMSGVTMKQTMYIATVGTKSYTVTVTEVKADSTLVSTVFDTLKEVK